MSSEEINDFVKKSTILQQTIKGIADGSIDETKVDLKKYGILTLEQQREEKERRAKAKMKFERKQAEKRKEEQEREKKQWWESAIRLYGPQADLGDQKNEEKTLHNCTEKTIQERYSSDYSRWTNKAYIPDDEATKEEEEEQKKLREKQQNEEFEKANKEWCNQIKDDMKKREQRVKSREQSALSLRMKGNKLFKRKKYSDALAKYSEALQLTPYTVNILTNLAIVHEKMNSWEESLDYCNRAIHINSNCTKALFLRHKALLHLNDEQNALNDLNRCVHIDPENKQFHCSYKKLSLKLQNDIIEAEVTCVVKESNGSESNLIKKEFVTPNKGYRNVTLEQILFTVTTQKGDPDHSLMIKKQCQIIDECRDVFHAHGLNHKVRDDRMIFSKEIDISAFRAFVRFKLCKCKIACAYMRTSGYMSHLLQELGDNCQSYERWITAEKSSTIEILKMMIEVMEVDEATRLFVTNFGIDHSLFQLFSIIDKEKDIDLIATLGQLIAGFIQNDNCETCERMSSFIVKEETFLHHLYQKMSLASSQNPPLPTSTLFKMVSVCADIVSHIGTHNILQRKVLLRNNCDGEHIVKCLLTSMHIPCIKNKSNSIEQSEMRKSIVKALMVLSTIHDFTQYILKITTTIPLLLALSTSFKSELEITREMALLTLHHLSIPLNSHIKVIEDIIAHNGIDILVNLCTNKYNSEESPSIKHRSSGLLSRIVSSSSSRIKLDEKTKVNIQNEFLHLTSYPKWTSVMDSRTAESVARTASHLLLVFIVVASTTKEQSLSLSSKPKPPLSSFQPTIGVRIILQLLPKPRVNSRGVVDCQSVCLSPEKAEEHTPMSFVSTNNTNRNSTSSTRIPAFHANLLKLLIHYLDTDPKCHNDILESNGIECLVSLIANSSSQNAAITKNASLVLARLVKANEAARCRCRELRGMEILMELGKAGRI